MIAIGEFSLQIISIVLGAYLLLKGFGIEEKIIAFFNELSSSLSEQRGSVPLYLGALLIPFFGAWVFYWQFITSNYLDIGMNIASSTRAALPMFVLAAILLGAGKAVDCFYMKKAYLLGKYFTWTISIVLLWSILDAGMAVFLRQANIDWFLTTIMVSLVVLVIAMKIGSIFDIRGKVTKLLVGANVVDDDGNMLGKIVRIDRKKQSIIFAGQKKREIEKTKKEFAIKQGKIIITA
jgi:uncharacterized membrane protein